MSPHCLWIISFTQVCSVQVAQFGHLIHEWTVLIQWILSQYYISQSPTIDRLFWSIEPIRVRLFPYSRDSNCWTHLVHFQFAVWRLWSATELYQTHTNGHIHPYISDAFLFMSLFSLWYSYVYKRYLTILFLSQLDQQMHRSPVFKIMSPNRGFIVPPPEVLERETNERDKEERQMSYLFWSCGSFKECWSCLNCSAPNPTCCKVTHQFIFRLLSINFYFFLNYSQSQRTKQACIQPRKQKKGRCWEREK